MYSGRETRLQPGSKKKRNSLSPLNILVEMSICFYPFYYSDSCFWKERMETTSLKPTMMVS